MFLEMDELNLEEVVGYIFKTENGVSGQRGQLRSSRSFLDYGDHVATCGEVL